MSVHFLKTKLCVGCRRGFELIDILTLRTQALLDPADSTLDFALKSGMDVPLALFRVNDGEFLLCYRGIVLQNAAIRILI